jgi:DNA-binding transcriptional ArsR family regulator
MATSDPKAIRALAHPVRLDLLELLVAISPATAARCGRVLGVSQASCSFHLRQLEKYGFVEDAGPSGDKRERLWRVVDRHLGVDTAGIDPLAAQQFGRVAIQREADRVLQYLDRRAAEPGPWRSAAGGLGTTLPMTADEAAEVKQGWTALLAPYEARAAASDYRLRPGQRYVRYFLAATPLPADFHPRAGSDEPAG